MAGTRENKSKTHNRTMTMRDIIQLPQSCRARFCFSTKSRLSVRVSHDCGKREKQQVGGFLHGDSMFTEKQINLFWSNVNVNIWNPNECWNWKLSTDRYGYGKVKASGKVYRSNRVAYEVINGAIPNGKSILHKCDNRLCCNPLHLYAGTRLDNVRDVIVRGRRLGVYVGRKMTFDKAEMLRKDFKQGISKYSLAKKYNIAPISVRDILEEKSWKRPLPHR